MLTHRSNNRRPLVARLARKHARSLGSALRCGHHGVFLLRRCYSFSLGISFAFDVARSGRFPDIYRLVIRLRIAWRAAAVVDLFEELPRQLLNDLGVRRLKVVLLARVRNHIIELLLGKTLLFGMPVGR